jgi:hypothetical protein
MSVQFWEALWDGLWTARTPFIVLAFFVTKLLAKNLPRPLERYHLRAVASLIIGHVAAAAIAAAQQAYGYESQLAETVSFAFESLAVVALGVTAIFRVLLPRVGFFDPKDVRDLSIGIVKRLSKHIGRAFGWQELLKEKQHRKVQRLAPLSPQAWIGARVVDQFRQPCVSRGLPPRAGRMEHVDRESRSRRNEERQRITDAAPVSCLPTNPDVLHDVFGPRDAAQHPIGNAK